LLELAGVVPVGTIDDLLAAGEALSNQPLPRGDRVVVITNAAGPGLLAARACEGQALRVPPLAPALRARLFAAGALWAANPVDLGADAGAERFSSVLQAVAEAGVADALLVIHSPTTGSDVDGVARAVEE